MDFFTLWAGVGVALFKNLQKGSEGMYSLPRGPPDRCRRAPPTFGCPAGKLDIGISCVFSSGQRVQFAVSAAAPRREPAASGRQPAALTGHLQTGHLEVLDLGEAP